MVTHNKAGFLVEDHQGRSQGGSPDRQIAHARLIQNSVDACACVKFSRWTAAALNPASLKRPKKLVKLSTMLCRP